ncbi:MAG: IS66 family transposase [Candidatus Nitrosoglobus sp.]
MERSRAHNLFECLRDFEANILCFMGKAIVSFTNNSGERDICMTKVQQKISGCFRS